MAHFLLSKKKLFAQYEVAKSLADSVSYSFKTNPIVGNLLEEHTDCQFSLHSTELMNRLSDMSRVWYFAQGFDDAEVGRLIKDGVKRFVVDNPADLEILLGYIKKHKSEIELLLRMRLKEHTVYTGKHFVFGMYANEINDHIKKLAANPNISKLGVHFHRKTQNISEWSLLPELCSSLSEETFSLIDIVNIGGGLPISYKNSHADTGGIFAKIGELRRFLNDKGITMIIEPGRFLAGPCVKLFSVVKNIYHGNIIIDASVYNSANDTFVANVRLEIEGELESGEAFTVKGCTPCSMDIFRYRVFLTDPKPGQEIVFLNAGAYTYSSDFCDLKPLLTKIVD
jgi:ornithine decarboxylase